MDSIKRALLLSPHTDDAELGAGAVISRLARQGVEISSVTFSFCEESTPVGFPVGCLKDECIAAMEVLGISDVRILDYPVRGFDRFRQDILEDLIRLRTEIQPDLILTPASTDCHQDHEVIHNESVRAFKNSTILGYIFPWNSLKTRPNVTVDVEPVDVETKINALACYHSQSDRNYFSPEVINAALIVAGSSVGVKYAEAFECIRFRLR
ncbi:PIG-L family deacetylase [Luminiphilus sp.]|nr:PIG-L family deacetylase [Luminiphilus sp.]